MPGAADRHVEHPGYIHGEVTAADVPEIDEDFIKGTALGLMHSAGIRRSEIQPGIFDFKMPGPKLPTLSFLISPAGGCGFFFDGSQ